VTQRLRAASSLPYTDVVIEAVEGLVPDGFLALQGTDLDDPVPDSVDEPDVTAAGAVRRGLLALVLALNGMLSEAGEHAHDLSDRQACEHATRLAYRLGSCWEGRLGTFLNDVRSDL